MTTTTRPRTAELTVYVRSDDELNSHVAGLQLTSQGQVLAEGIYTCDGFKGSANPDARTVSKQAALLKAVVAGIETAVQIKSIRNLTVHYDQAEYEHTLPGEIAGNIKVAEHLRECFAGAPVNWPELSEAENAGLTQRLRSALEAVESLSIIGVIEDEPDKDLVRCDQLTFEGTENLHELLEQGRKPEELLVIEGVEWIYLANSKDLEQPGDEAHTTC